MDQVESDQYFEGKAGNNETLAARETPCLFADLFTSDLRNEVTKIKLKELRAQIGKYLPLAAFLIVLIAAFEVLWGHLEPMAATAKMLILVAEIGIILGVPICLIVSVFRRARSFAAFGLLLISCLLGLSLWLWSLVLADELAGAFWTVMGLCLAGVGIVPVAFIAALLQTEWAQAIQIAVVAVAFYAIGSMSYFIASGAEHDSPKRRRHRPFC